MKDGEVSARGEMRGPHSMFSCDIIRRYVINTMLSFFFQFPHPIITFFISHPPHNASNPSSQISSRFKIFTFILNSIQKKKMVMAEEFQESDVIFSDEYDSSSSSGGGRNEYNFNYRDQKTKGMKKQRKRQNSGSIPIHIPRNVTTCSTCSDHDSDEDDQVLPPHLIVAKRVKEGMAFSVKGGYGRALKGRELSEFRNSILRMTGFLET